MNDPVLRDRALSKVPEVTLVFWISDHDAEPGVSHWYGDILTLLIALGSHRSFRSGSILYLYWATVVASITFGTTMADFASHKRSGPRSATGPQIPVGWATNAAPCLRCRSRGARRSVLG